ncbi:phosphate ABC transporter (ATP-binding protein) [Weissella viridescens]|jgi:phosphate transport system ATP-binding protein|uniref:ABC-type phosphate transport system, ATPase component n=1 Tax=Weissella viridescens TaxID=1629 RepID=A0A0R2HA45_WEIVI|nr:phosphate ABC transporter ATP-binding protein PstB [Weissella viridescens]KRN46666.1 ABC-type phosphate transport system, ATPase component [Weissella viridescens]MBX4172801.1 phosphate ABC transporter ATP-binding protein PstB [Weissella viridescens]QOD86447.1 phosphate ABC transporter ATP-binding protein [Weissella viridescens]WJI91579.1 phosphate ABC transporter ATP-binding protein PstB [Weissella viridescens]SOB42324.1 phosphate ABC transporter (ATP-binding protein) [Weissella viridescens
MTDKILTTENVHLYYGEKEALHGINLDYDQYGITALIGPSGSGKSTYLRALNRMHDLQDNVTVNGTFMFKGHDIYAPDTDTVALRKDIGMVFQQPNPFPFSIYDNVAFGLRISGENNKAVIDEKVETSLKQAAVWDEVKDTLHKSALSLSGGQQQRVSIARALATAPEILLLDEPTAALDPVSSHKVENTLMTLRDQYTMIIVTHSMSQASRISDRTAFFMSGDLIEVDSTKQMFLNPSEEKTQDYISGRFG